MIAAALLVHLVAQVAAPPAPTPVPVPVPARRDTLVLVDDRSVKDQAPPAFVARVVEELARRKGLQPERLSIARKRLAPREDKELAACGDDAGCLATIGRELDAKLVVTIRLTRPPSGGAGAFLAITRVNALRPQASDDAGTLVGTDADALAAVPESVGELFADFELRAP